MSRGPDPSLQAISDRGHDALAAGDHVEAAAAARRLIKASPTPEAWLLLASALERLGKLPAARTAFREALALDPGAPDIHRGLAQLVWMTTGDRAAALEALEAALRARPNDRELLRLKPLILGFTGDPPGALAAAEAACARFPDDLGFVIQAAQIAADHGFAEPALRHAAAAVRAAPQLPGAHAAMALALLAAGDPAAALHGLERARPGVSPDDQYLLAVTATAWRMLGDPRYRRLYDYDAFVRRRTLPTPKGWRSLPAFLADLKATLERLHPFAAPPFSQSVRAGSQTLQNLAQSRDPVVRAFFAAAGEAVDAHVAEIGRGDDPLRRRNTGRWRIPQAWSVRLKAGGSHADHVHHRGWLSSAFYVDVPPVAADTEAREGWLKLGEPGVVTRPPLPAERFERPEPGVLVLFPAYMWHGTTPFTGGAPRLSLAFDVVPA